MTVFRCLATFFQLCLLHFARYGRTELQDWSLHGPVVTTHYGFVRGYYLSNASVFLGIPYATPPVGPRKFQKPSDPKPWDHPLQADQYSPMCPQTPNERAPMGEDCLYLNVFTPSSKPESLLPIMVWFYGGGYETGASSDLTPEMVVSRFVSEGVVFVTFNYRLNFYGFFALLDDRFLPNRGLWDQLQALKWIQSNIDRFGGDPSQVTLIGDEAGASSIGFLLWSPRSKGLFRRVILHNGSPFNPWSLMTNQTEHDDVTRKTIEAIGCGVGSTLVECISNASQGKIWNAWREVHGRRTGQLRPMWAPVLDGQRGILPFDNIGELESQVPEDIEIMLGTSSYRDWDPGMPMKTEDVNYTAKTFNRTAASIIQSLGVSDKNVDLAASVAEIAYGRLESWEKTTKALIFDYWIKAGVIKLAKLLMKSESNRVYLYFEDNDKMALPLQFSQPTLDSQNGSISVSENRSDLLIALWLNFAITGDPNPETDAVDLWQPFDQESYSCLSLGDNPEMKNKCFWTCDQFWNSLIPLLQRKTMVEQEESMISCESASCSAESDSSWTETHVHRVAICAVLLVCICTLFASLYVIRRMRQRLRTYHLLAAVAELNFT